jgi:hypothetical protein
MNDYKLTTGKDLRVFLLPPSPGELLGPHSLLTNWYLGKLFSMQEGRQNVKMTTHLHTVTRLRMSSILPIQSNIFMAGSLTL